MGGNGGGSSTSLAPGFRFHPTDEELVSYYLKRKVCGKPFRFDAISEIEVYKSEPWDLPGLSKLKTRDLEWYFFSNLDKKYGNGSRTNRATAEGYWKTTGKDRPVHHRTQVVGMKKTLVYHRGRAPRGDRTNWVMHEYRLTDERHEKAGVPQEAFVLCRIFQKSGSGPKNGEKYGAPFVEEEWEDDNEVVTLPGEPVAGEVFVSDESFNEGNDLDQNLALEFPLEGPTPSLNLYQGEENNYFENMAENGSTPSTLVNKDQVVLETNDDQKFFNLPVQLEAEAVKNEYAVQPTNVMSHIPVNLPREQCLDNVNNAPSDEGFFLEANDLLEPIEGNSLDFQLLDEYPYFDADNDIGQYLTFDSSDMLDADGTLSDQAFFMDQNLDQANDQASTSSFQLPEAYSVDNASSSKQVTEAKISEPDLKYPFMEQASQMLGNFPAPPAFASEFPTKDMAARLHAAAQSSDSAHVTAGMIRIRDLPVTDNGMHWSFDKRGTVSVVLSLNLPEGIVSSTNIQALTGMVSGKMPSIMSRGWFCFLLFSVTVLCISAKVGTCIYAK